MLIRAIGIIKNEAELSSRFSESTILTNELKQLCNEKSQEIMRYLNKIKNVREKNVLKGKLKHFKSIDSLSTKLDYLSKDLSFILYTN